MFQDNKQQQKKKITGKNHKKIYIYYMGEIKNFKGISKLLEFVLTDDKTIKMIQSYSDNTLLLF